MGWVLGAIGFSLYAFFTPIALGHPDNSIHANPLTTPAHIVPEWYFLALYAILRSIPNKQSGVAAVALVIFTLVHLGWGSTSSKNRCVTVQPLGLWVSGVYAIADALHLFWILGADVLILGWSGSHCTPHAIRIGQLWGAYSFLCFAILIFIAWFTLLLSISSHSPPSPPTPLATPRWLLRRSGSNLTRSA